jgi:hypothetical protein
LDLIRIGGQVDERRALRSSLSSYRNDDGCGRSYEPACQVTPDLEAAPFRFGHTSSERALPLHPAKGCARERVLAIRVIKHPLHRWSFSEVPHPLIRARVWLMMIDGKPAKPFSARILRPDEPTD